MSYAIRCPKCRYHSDFYKAPLGKVVRNPYADLTKAVHDNCNACNGTGYVSGVVIDSIRKSFPKDADTILQELRWSGDHFSFVRWGMYIGVETDGTCHS